MMRTAIALAFTVVLGAAGCRVEPPVASTLNEQAKRTSNEKIYHLQGTIVGRDATAATLTIRHGPIGDWIGAMTMTFPVRGASVTSLPDNGVPITAKVHVSSNGDFWVSDVTAAPPGSLGSPAPQTDTSGTGSTDPQEISL